MEFHGQFLDGLTANPFEVGFEILDVEDKAELVIQHLDTGTVLARWPVNTLLSVPARKGQLRITSSRAASGARLVINGEDEVRAVHLKLPGLSEVTTSEKRRQRRTIFISTGTLVLVALAYFFGVPLFARQIVAVMPPQWESQIGDTVLHEFESGNYGSMRLCDSSDASLANAALHRFVDEVIAPYDIPFDVKLRVVHNPIENAFALPGGNVFYFSGLLAKTQTQDEFAGVLSHELGHVYHRHAMETLVSSAGTGLLVGFVLGDMTGISVAGVMMSALIDSSYSRDVEREADAFAADAARRLGFSPLGLANLLERVAADDDASSALSLLSSHPLTSERRANLESLDTPTTEVPPFTDEEWQAIRNMCGSSAVLSGTQRDDRKINK